MINISKKYVQAYFNGLPNMIKTFTYTHKGVLNSDPPITF